MFKKRIMFVSVLCGIAVLIAIPAHAELLVNEQFNTDGPLAGMTPGPGPGEAWVAHSSAGNKTQTVSGGSVTLEQSTGIGEDCHVGFANQPTNSTTFYRLDLMLPSGQTVDPDANGNICAHLGMDNGWRARLGILSPAGGGDFRIALGNDSSSLGGNSTVWPGGDLSFDTTYVIVCSYNASTGEAELWVDPEDENSTSITLASTDSGRVINGLSLRQSNDYTGSQVIDSICVATSFAEVCVTDVPTQPTDILFNQSWPLLSSATNGTDFGGFQTLAAYSRPWVYSLVAGVGDTDNSSFQISGDRLQTATNLTGQGGSVLSFRVQTEDSGLFTQKVFQVTVEADTDADGLPDDWELTWAVGLGQLDGDGVADADSDGLTDLDEFQLWYEQAVSVDPLDDDTDGDTLLDGEEVAGAGERPPTDPTDADTDGDGLDDGVETDTGTYVDSSDTGTDPTDTDTDNDTLEDDVEVPTGVYVSPANPGTHPLTPDTDGDGLTDGDEISSFATIPVDWDTDGDTAGDGLEDWFLSDPTNGGDVPGASFWPVAKQTWNYPDTNHTAQVTIEIPIDASGFGTQIELQRGEQLVLSFDITGHEGGDADNLDIRLGFAPLEGHFDWEGYMNPAIDVGPPTGTTAVVRYRNGSTVYGSTVNNQLVATTTQIPANGGVDGTSTVNSVSFTLIRSDVGYTGVLQWEEIVLEASMTPVQYWCNPLWDKFFIRLWADSGVDEFKITNISVTYGNATAPLIRPVVLTDLTPVTSPSWTLQFDYPTDLGSSAYELQGSSDLTNPGAWAPVLSGIPVGGATDTVSTVVVPSGDVGASNRNYRIVVP